MNKINMKKELLNIGHDNVYWYLNNEKEYGSVVESYLKEDGWYYLIFGRRGFFKIMNNRIGVDIFRAE